MSGGWVGASPSLVLARGSLPTALQPPHTQQRDSSTAGEQDNVRESLQVDLIGGSSRSRFQQVQGCRPRFSQAVGGREETPRHPEKLKTKLKRAGLGASCSVLTARGGSWSLATRLSCVCSYGRWNLWEEVKRGLIQEINH